MCRAMESAYPSHPLEGQCLVLEFGYQSALEFCMRWVLIVLAVVGILASSLALREHYRTDISPCSINERWDCGIVNHSPYAMLFGVPVAVIGIAGYLLLPVLAFMKSYWVLLAAARWGLGFALHLSPTVST